MFRPNFLRRVPPLLLLVIGLGSSPAHAQATPAVPPLLPGEMFRQVFGADAKPTGKNGYEDLVLAVEALQASPLFLEADAHFQGLTLEDQRRVVKDRPVQRALVLMRLAVGKPVVSPRASLAFGAKLPELTGFRKLARLLVMLQYVQLADGRVPDAIGTARLCLRVGQVIQTDTIQSTLAGMSIEGICIRSLADHLDQFSANDCKKLFEVCREWLAQPQPSSSETIGKAELASVDQFIADLRAAGPEKVPSVLRRELGLSKSAAEQVRSYVSALSPAELDTLASGVSSELHSYYSRALAELRKPAWQRNRAALRPDEGGQLSLLTGQLRTSLDRVGDRMTREIAQIRLLACHAAVLRYRWEKNALPPNLEALNLGDLAQDPFTGQSFQYQPKKRQYRLFSAGRPAEGDDPQAVGGRRPISVTPEE